MNPETLSILRCPMCGANLTHEGAIEKGRLRQGQLLCTAHQHPFPVRDGVPWFIQPDDLQGLNRRYATLYSWIAPFYDSSFFIASYVRRQFWPSGEERARREIIERLEISPGDKILETGIGTGSNVPYLTEKADDLTIFGLDVSLGMLNQCARQLKRWKQEAELFLAQGERLPYVDGSFDVVFHVGGINTFNDKKPAIEEMIRVAKPGTRIVIADEVEELAADAKPISKAGLRLFFGKQLTEEILDFSAEDLLELVPPEMGELQFDTIWDGMGYLLSFRKP